MSCSVEGCDRYGGRSVTADHPLCERHYARKQDRHEHQLGRVEAVLARVLTGAPVGTATDDQGQYITRESARELAELVGTDVIDALVVG